MTALVVVCVLLAVIGVLGYVWKHRTGTLARGIGAAGVRYNELYGQGGPPRIPPPAAHGTTTPSGLDTDPMNGSGGR